MRAPLMLAGVLAASATALAPHPARAATVLTVAQNGSGEYTSVQAAINAVPAGGSPYVISIGAGTYNEVIDVPSSKPNLTLEGATGNAENVVIAYGNAAWMTNSSGATLGTAGSATATIAASDVTVENLTIANTYNPAAYSEGYSQAVALNAEGDKMIFNGDRFLGLQDTLLAWEPTPSLPAQIKSVPWTTMSGYSFAAGRYYEYDNSGPGSGTGSGRPQLTSAQAAGYTPQTYLAGADGWNPLG